MNVFGQNFPISDYYKNNILDAKTLSNRAGWWTAVLLIKDPQTQKSFVSVYRWQHTEAGWKMRNRMHVRSRADAKLLIESIEKFAKQLD